MVTVIDYNLGNILSVVQALEYLGHNVKIATDGKDIAKANYILIPGVGAFPKGMENLKKKGFIDAIKNKAYENTPILGICLGMQLLFTKSNEIYETNGLNLIEGDVVKLSNNINGIEFKVPNIGWRQTFLNEDHIKNKKLKDFCDNKSFYYLHSYHVVPMVNDANLAYFYRYL